MDRVPTAAERVKELKQVLIMLEKRADNLEKKIVKVFDSNKFSRKKPIIRKRRLSEILWVYKFANATTIHGLKEVLTEPHPFLHSIWTFLFCSCLALCAYHVCQVINEYGKEMTISKIKIMRQDIYEFPVILLCPDTWLDEAKINASGLSRGGIELALAYLINYGLEPPPYEIENHTRAGIEFDEWYEKSNFSNLADFFKYMALDSWEFVEECTFCTPNRTHNFTKVLMNGFVCYQLPIEPIEGGSSLGDPDIFRVRTVDRSGGLLLKRSYWRVFVNPDLTLGMSDTHFLHVYPGFSNTIRIRPRQFLSLSSDQCVSKEEINSRNGYSQSSCIGVCFAESQQPFCQQMSLFPSRSMPRNHSNFCHSYPNYFWRPQENETETEPGPPTPPRDDDVHVHLISEPLECFHRCPPACEKLVYETSVESHPLISDGLRLENETRFHILNDVVQYFGMLSYEEVVTYSFDRLVSNVGGMLGLWLGASVVSLIQLPLWICTALRKSYEERRRSRRAAPRKKKCPRQTSV